MFTLYLNRLLLVLNEKEQKKLYMNQLPPLRLFCMCQAFRLWSGGTGKINRRTRKNRNEDTKQHEIRWEAVCEDHTNVIRMRYDGGCQEHFRLQPVTNGNKRQFGIEGRVDGCWEGKLQLRRFTSMFFQCKKFHAPVDISGVAVHVVRWVRPVCNVGHGRGGLGLSADNAWLLRINATGSASISVTWQAVGGIGSRQGL